jgi:hypothetical protein
VSQTLFRLRIKAGEHERNDCPVSFRINRNAPEINGVPLTDPSLVSEDGHRIPGQWTEEGEDLVLHFVIGHLPRGASAEYIVTAGGEPDSGGVRFIEKENKLDVEIAGKYFTSFVYDPEIAKPYIGPVMGPYGDSFTRLDFETKEHPHHRSIWLGIGDVNGIDIWNEPAGRHGKQKLTGFAEKTDGPVLARFSSTQVWTTFDGKPQVDESRTVTFYNTPEHARFVDFDFTFTVTRGQVEFGATKEAGPLGIRVAESMKVDNGGTMVNSFGSVGEAECWGQRAQWCDYFGNVGGHTLGIAAFDHPDNADYPTYWHIRNYGLLAANNFYFLGGKLFKKGQSISYKHRIYFHEGDTTQGKVADKYQDYIHPPKIEKV